MLVLSGRYHIMSNASIVNNCIMYDYCEPGTTRYLGLEVSLADSGTGALAKLIPGQAPIFAKFFLHFYRFMLNYFIQVIRNYKNDKNTPLHFILNYA